MKLLLPGAFGACVTAAITAFIGSKPALGSGFLAAAFVVGLLAEAHRLPGLHRMPGFGSAPVPRAILTIPPDRTEHEMTADAARGPIIVRPGPWPREVLASMSFRNNHRDYIDRLSFNAWVHPSDSITRCEQTGEPMMPGKEWGSMLTADGPYWQGRLDLPPGSLVMFFLVTLPRPGTYEAVMRFNAPMLRGDGYERRCQFSVVNPSEEDGTEL